MRLTCPNCGAQYEVPDEVIPDEGRDVQCSNCGDTWFQEHPDHPMAISPDMQADDDLAGAAIADPPDPVAGEADDPGPDLSQTPRSGLDGPVRDMLRQEAEREAGLRAAETAGSVESQPELGLDGDADDALLRAGEARERMSAMRGQDPDQPAPPDDPAAADSRRGLLPDIEEINSTLKSDDGASLHTALSTQTHSARTPGRKRGGFTRGFAISLVLVAGLLLIYSNAPQIARQFPQVDPLLNAYVAQVDQARLWLDSLIGELVPK